MSIYNYANGKLVMADSVMVSLSKSELQMIVSQRIGRPAAVRFSGRGGRDVGLDSVVCPYCNKEHYHSSNEGHRAAHCFQVTLNGVVLKEDQTRRVHINGQEFTREDGYYVLNVELALLDYVA
jgi:hypothetical protein